MKIRILFDCPDQDNDKKWLIEGLQCYYGEEVQSVSIHETLSRLGRRGVTGKVKLYWTQLKQCIRAIATTSPGGVSCFASLKR